MRSLPLRLAVLAHLLPVDPADARPARHVRARPEGHHDLRLVDRAAPPVRGQPVDAVELPDGPRQRRHGQRVHQQPDRDHPVGRHPDHHRRIRRLRVRVGPVPRPRHPVHDRGGPAGRADPDVADPDPAALRGREPVRLVPWHLAGAHGLRPAAGDLPALQLHLAAAARPVRVRRDRRRDASPDVHPARPAAVDPGPRRDRHLPVPVGLE